MKTDIRKIAEEMVRREKFAGLKVVPPFVVRLDIRNARALCRKYFQKGGRLSEDFHNMLVNVTKELINVEPYFDMAFIESDEISIICLCKTPNYSGRVEKIDSIIAGEASSLLTLFLLERGIKTSVAFDSRIIKVNNLKQVRDYLVFRQADGFRNAVNWLSETVKSPKALKGVKMTQRLRIITKAGIKIEKWAKWGTLVYKTKIKKTVIDQKTGKQTTAEKQQIATYTGDKLDYVLNRLQKGN